MNSENRFQPPSPAEPAITNDDRSSRLAQALEDASVLAIERMRDILERPIPDEKPATMLKAQCAAAQVVLVTQTRADSNRLRAAREDRALVALLALMKRKEVDLPPPGNFGK